MAQSVVAADLWHHHQGAAHQEDHPIHVGDVGDETGSRQERVEHPVELDP